MAECRLTLSGICHTDEYTRSGKDPEVRDFQWIGSRYD